MILFVFSVEDTRAGMFSPPFMMRSNGEALRAFSELANDKKTSVGQHPTEFRLVRLCTFDDELGLFDGQEKLQLGLASDFVAQREVPVGVTPLKAVDNGK